MRFLKSWSWVFLWAGLMFLLSTDYGSGGRTLAALLAAARWLHIDLAAAEIDRLNFFLRKGAHMSEYALLAVLLWRALAVSGGWPAWGWNRRTWGEALLIALAFAVGDEFHQLFVPTRGSSIVDVAIDAGGAVGGLAAAAVAVACLRKRRG